MNFNVPPPPPAPVIPPDPNLEEIKKQAEEDKKDALQERVGRRTQELLLRYGARGALSGARTASPLTL